MSRCPNCGRETARTEDWVCQWCGYPLLSGSFKRVTKTFRELQEERQLATWRTVEEGEEEVLTSSREGSSPVPKTKPPLEQMQPPASEPESKQVLEPEPEPAVSESEPIAEAETQPEPATPAAEVEPEPEAMPTAEAEMQPGPAAPAAEVEPGPRPEAVTGPEPVTGGRIVPEVIPGPAPAPVPSLEPDAALNAIVLTVEELNSAFRSDKETTNAKLANNILKVTGNVSKVVVKDYLDIAYILLVGAGKSEWEVRCTFGKNHSSHLSRLTLGQRIAVQGRYGGYGRNIIMKDCMLV